MSQRKCIDTGPSSARIMLVGEAPGETEENMGVPFVGRSGIELTRMLMEAGIDRTQCYVTNVCKHRPPGNKIESFFRNKTDAKKQRIDPFMGRYPTAQIREGLRELEIAINNVRPHVIIALGGTALWALTGMEGIDKYRGSYLRERSTGAWVIPTYHPARVLRQWYIRNVTVHDLRRAASILKEEPTEPDYRFHIRPSFPFVMDTLSTLRAKADTGPLKLAHDLETAHRFIECSGLAWSPTEALCVPFMSAHDPKGYWRPEEEEAIIMAHRALFLHPNVNVVGQNYLYDAQYTARFWGVCKQPYFDTMIAQGVCWPGMPKGLDYISSLYCDWHVYWKDDGKEANKNHDDMQRWTYNCKDCVVTYESSGVLDPLIDKLGLRKAFDFEMNELWSATLHMMLRGVPIDLTERAKMAAYLRDELARVEEALIAMMPPELVPQRKGLKPWYRSPQQQSTFFYRTYGIKEIRKRGTNSLTSDDEALEKIAGRDPMLRPLCEMLQYYRSLGVFYSTFVMAELDHDGRIRCSYNPVGTETFRYNSSEDAFGFGTNLQNIPSGDEE